MRYTLTPSIMTIKRPNLMSSLPVQSQPPFLLTPAMLVCWISGLLMGGVTFLVAMAVCWVLIRVGGSDLATKHGLSSTDATRVGGVLIASYVVASVAYHHLWGEAPFAQLATVALLSALAFYFLGLLEDLRGDIKAGLRFAVMLGFANGSLWVSPDFLLAPVGIWVVDGLLNISVASQFIFTAVCIGFLPNACNTSDGANGLLSGTAFLGFLALSSWFDSEMSYLLLYGAIGTLLFFLFNVTSGQFFLGDGGAYFLGALMGFGVIHVANANVVSVWCLLSLIFYPVADLLWSMGRRVLSGKSPMAPDNFHLHNLIHDVALTKRMSDRSRNTATGLMLVAVFSGLPWALYWSIDSVTGEWWRGLVYLQWVIYIVLWVGLTLSQRSET